MNASKGTTGGAKTGGGKTATPTPSLADTILGRKPKQQAPKAGAGSANGTPGVDGKKLAPKVGAKPVNPKRGTAPKRGNAPKARRLSG